MIEQAAGRMQDDQNCNVKKYKYFSELQIESSSELHSYNRSLTYW